MARARLSSNAPHAAALHEQRTGMRANMRQLGWTCGKRSTVDGHPLEFKKGRDGDSWRVGRTVSGKWYCAKVNRTPGSRFTKQKRVRGPDFDGPVAAALWLQVEIANDTVRFD